MQATMDTNSFQQIAVIKRDNENRLWSVADQYSRGSRLAEANSPRHIPTKMSRARSTEIAAVLKIRGSRSLVRFDSHRRLSFCSLCSTSTSHVGEVSLW